MNKKLIDNIVSEVIIRELRIVQVRRSEEESSGGVIQFIACY